MHTSHYDTQISVQPAECDGRQPLISNDTESIERALRGEATRIYVERVDRYLAQPDMPRRTALALRYGLKI